MGGLPLRELVGRLCEAELQKLGLSPAAVTWGGSQTAADGGLDVRVALPKEIPITGFIPRASTGFQVKKPDMPRASILTEMRPRGVIRPVIQELANDKGSYIIICSGGTTADSALRNRQNALREGLAAVDNAELLHTDFYDRTRLATWVRGYPGIIAWVKKKIGRSLGGWYPYGAWSTATEDIKAEYLLDNRLSLHFEKQNRSEEHAQTMEEAINRLRSELAQPRQIVRLVGLSGVGKTRLVQALFDSRIGACFLPPSLAVYTNLSDNPNPQPIGLASDLIANRKRAVLIVDNCPPELHSRLSELCRGQDSTISVITVEYDVRADQPEGTQLVRLDSSSTELIEKLIERRYPQLSQVNARTIAEASGGNSRIAIALAETVDSTDALGELTNEELFQRLFRQRHEPNNNLLLAAQAFSLVYSFDGNGITGEEAHLPRLASLVSQTPQELYLHVSELMRRNLVQQRGIWRAVLPHAIANRLAARALEDIPFDLINQQLVNGGAEHLARSFSRRLSFLHEYRSAIEIVEKWLSPNGLLGDVTLLNALGRAMFENIAPVQPEKALEVLERAKNGDITIATTVLRQHLGLLRSLAYDSCMFERSAQLILLTATRHEIEENLKEASDIFLSLFPIYLSGTHATVEQRLKLIEFLLKSNDAESKKLGLAALDKMLEVNHFFSGYQFDFGARSRDYGFEPQNAADVTYWYSSILNKIEQLGLVEKILKSDLEEILAQHFRGLWTIHEIQGHLETLFLRFATNGFWRSGWAACKETMKFDKDHMSPEARSQLSTLINKLSPNNLPNQVRGFVLGNQGSFWYDLDEESDDEEVDTVIAHDRLIAKAKELGEEVAENNAALAEILPELLTGGTRVWVFARGLASKSPNIKAHWQKLIDEAQLVSKEQFDPQLLSGFVCEVWQHDQELAHQLLDSTLDHLTLQLYLPVLHSGMPLDERALKRLDLSLQLKLSPIGRYKSLAYGCFTELISTIGFKSFLLLISEQTDGFEVALEIFYYHQHLYQQNKKVLPSEFLETGRALLRRIHFKRENRLSDYQLEKVSRICLSNSDAESDVKEIVITIKKSIKTGQIYGVYGSSLLNVLVNHHPTIFLKELFSDKEQNRRIVSIFLSFGYRKSNFLDSISVETLITWCNDDREYLYPLAASIISFSQRSGSDQTWSDQAKALISGAPDIQKVIDAFIERFRPSQWSGSRASIMEENSRLLDSLIELIPPSFIPYLDATKSRLGQAILKERKCETDHDKDRDERFEW
ncbi:MAG: hypothetical protein Q7U16_10390 [Agitococcus sp.]|nr:hypothetical protein [Agitococcus sp.]